MNGEHPRPSTSPMKWAHCHASSEGASFSHSRTNVCSACQTSIEYQVPHVRQLYSWDCGLACALMVLHAVGYTQVDYGLLRQICPVTSIWTVDLAHLLRRFGIGVIFHTVTLGPNPAFHNETFYLANMQDDEARVSRLFLEAGPAGITLSQLSLPCPALTSALASRHSLLLVLVDKRKLEPWLAAADACLPYALCGLGGAYVAGLGYTGHYLLIVGWDGSTQEYIVRDPASPYPELRLSPGALDDARCAFGTDEDLLVLSHPQLHSRVAPAHAPCCPTAAMPAPLPATGPQSLPSFPVPVAAQAVAAAGSLALHPRCHWHPCEAQGQQQRQQQPQQQPGVVDEPSGWGQATGACTACSQPAPAAPCCQRGGSLPLWPAPLLGPPQTAEHVGPACPHSQPALSCLRQCHTEWRREASIQKQDDDSAPLGAPMLETQAASCGQPQLPDEAMELRPHAMEQDAMDMQGRAIRGGSPSPAPAPYAHSIDLTASYSWPGQLPRRAYPSGRAYQRPGEQQQQACHGWGVQGAPQLCPTHPPVASYPGMPTLPRPCCQVSSCGMEQQTSSFFAASSPASPGMLQPASPHPQVGGQADQGQGPMGVEQTGQQLAPYCCPAVPVQQAGRPAGSATVLLSSPACPCAPPDLVQQAGEVHCRRKQPPQGSGMECSGQAAEEGKPGQCAEQQPSSSSSSSSSSSWVSSWWGLGYGMWGGSSPAASGEPDIGQGRSGDTACAAPCSASTAQGPTAHGHDLPPPAAALAPATTRGHDRSSFDMAVCGETAGAPAGVCPQSSSSSQRSSSGSSSRRPSSASSSSSSSSMEGCRSEVTVCGGQEGVLTALQQSGAEVTSRVTGEQQPPAMASTAAPASSKLCSWLLWSHFTTLQPTGNAGSATSAAH
ncbi:hypothetical protein QJQ45_023701 [Haematococcus lacustris]|nr:hypothetical protein QJQ45_023701 [Haematococcus lacustris]